MALAGGMLLLGLGACGGLVIFSLGGEEETALAKSAPAPIKKAAAPIVAAVEAAPAAPEPAKPAAAPAVKPVETAAVDKTAAEIAELPQNNERWARDGEDEEAPEAAEPEQQVASAPPVEDDDADPTATAAIAPQEALGYAPVEPLTAEPEPMANDEGDEAGRKTTVSRAVNMRVKPVSGSKVIMVVPVKSTVGVIGCKSWCEITYKGSRGWVYKSFLAGQGGGSGQRQVRRASAAPETEAALKPVTANKPAKGLPGVFSTARER